MPRATKTEDNDSDAGGDAPAADVTGPRSLTRVLGLFDVLSYVPAGMSLAELSITLGTPKSSLLNLLRPLVKDGYLIQSDGRYLLGASIIKLAAGVMSAWNFPKMIRPFMEDLVQRTGETVMLGVLNREAEVLAYTEIIDSPSPVRLQVPVGMIRPLYASPAGWVVLAHADKPFRDQYLGTVQFKVKMSFPITRAWLARELEKVREEGVAVAIDPTVRGASGISAPVFDGNGGCVAALTVGGPTSRLVANLESLKTAVKEVATKASGVASNERFQPRQRSA